jgi:large subunit ribosomal protein L10
MVVHQKGLTATDVTELQTQMRAEGASYFVSKNTLSRLAVKDTSFAGIAEFLEGPTALAFSSSPVAVANAVFRYAKSKEGKITVLGGSYGERVLRYEELEVLSRLPSLEVLRSTIVGLIEAPLQRIARLLSVPASQVARCMAAYAEKRD